MEMRYHRHYQTCLVKIKLFVLWPSVRRPSHRRRRYRRRYRRHRRHRRRHLSSVRPTVVIELK